MYVLFLWPPTFDTLPNEWKQYVIKLSQLLQLLLQNY